MATNAPLEDYFQRASGVEAVLLSRTFWTKGSNPLDFEIMTTFLKP